MPTYEYACRDCGEHLEVVQSFKDAPLTVCGSCGGGLRKVFSAAGIIFKGSGYYVTDTRGDQGGQAAKGDKAPAGGDGGGGGDSTSGAKGEGTKSDGTKREGSKGDSKGSDSSSSSPTAKSA